jgi:hypothetical protein
MSVELTVTGLARQAAKMIVHPENQSSIAASTQGCSRGSSWAWLTCERSIE